MNQIKLALLLGAFVCFSSCKENPASPTGTVTDKAMVVSAREEASKIGSDIMQQGGNAFDAMVGTQLALAVAYPRAGNISGEHIGRYLCWRAWFCCRNNRST